jgi:hypothetical protein
MRIRRRNWILKRIVLGFAVAALVAPAAAQARVDEGGVGQPNSSSEISSYVPGVTDFPSAVGIKSTDQVPFLTDARSSANGSVQSREYGMPRAMPSDYARQVQADNTVRSIDAVENARLTPRGGSVPQVVASHGFDWSDAGIGAGLALGLVLIGGAAFRTTRHLGRPQTA